MKKIINYGTDKYKNPNPARIISENKEDYILVGTDGNIINIRKTHNMPDYYTGDVVEIIKGRITKLIERRNTVKKSANKTAKSFHNANKNQILASNVDQLFVLMAVNQNFSMAKLERYMLVFSHDDYEMHIVLTKTDLISKEKCNLIKSEITDIYPDIHLHSISIYDVFSTEKLALSFEKGKTGLFMGSSGAGKTSLINKLIGTAERTNTVRSDGKGRHTTTSAKILYSEKYDYYIIDTPGFKGIDKNEYADSSVLFEDISEIATRCKFSDCRHINEPGCAVKEAVKNGTLSKEKYERYLYNQKRLKMR